MIDSTDAILVPCEDGIHAMIMMCRDCHKVIWYLGEGDTLASLIYRARTHSHPVQAKSHKALDQAYSTGYDDGVRDTEMKAAGK